MYANETDTDTDTEIETETVTEAVEGATVTAIKAEGSTYRKRMQSEHLNTKCIYMPSCRRAISNSTYTQTHTE